MKRLKLLGLALIAVFALGAVIAMPAVAEEETPTVELEAVKEGKKFPITFTSESDSTSKPTLETAAGAKVRCLKAKNTGEFTSSRLGEVKITYEGCEEPVNKFNCWNTPAESKEIKMEADIHLVDFEKEKILRLGIEFLPLNALHENLIEFKCSTITVKVKGSAIGLVDGVVAGVATKHLTLLFHQTLGGQEIKECHWDKTFCEGKLFNLEADLGAGFIKAGEEAEILLLFTNNVIFRF